MIELPNPKCPPNQMDKLVFGADCARHPLLGCIIGHGNGPPDEQARNFVRSLLKSGQVTETEFKDLWAGLEL